MRNEVDGNSIGASGGSGMRAATLRLGVEYVTKKALAGDLTRWRARGTRAPTGMGCRGWRARGTRAPTGMGCRGWRARGTRAPTTLLYCEADRITKRRWWGVRFGTAFRTFGATSPRDFSAS